MKKLIFDLLIVAYAMFAVCSAANASERWLISIPHIDVRELPVAALPKPQRESIVGIKIVVSGGAIASLRDVPIGWNIAINNDPSWNTTLTGTLIVAAAALDPEYLTRSFVIITKAPAGLNPDAEHAFDVRVEVALSADFEHERRLTFGGKDLLIRRESR